MNPEYEEMHTDVIWEVVDEVAGKLMGELLCGLLNAEGVRARFSQEAIGNSVFPVTVGPLAEVQILVPEAEVERAKMILDDYYAGKFNLEPSSEESSEEVLDDDGGDEAT